MRSAKIKHGGKIKVCFALLCFLFLIVPHSTFGASLFVKSEGMQEDGLLALSVYASTKQQKPFNAASAEIHYPKDLLSLESLDINESVFNLWHIKPVLSSEGTIVFSGGTSAKGGLIFEGKLFEMFVRPNTNGSGVVQIQNAQVLASDGEGTNILENTNGYIFRKEQAIPAHFDKDLNGVVSLQELSISLAEGS